MVARRYKSLAHGSNKDNVGFGKKVVFHREHRSKKGRQTHEGAKGHLLWLKKEKERLKNQE